MEEILNKLHHSIYEYLGYNHNSTKQKLIMHQIHDKVVVNTLIISSGNYPTQFVQILQSIHVEYKQL